MLEIIVLVILCMHIHKILKEKGIPSLKYIATLLALWLGLEILLAAVGIFLFESERVAYGLGMAGAMIGGVIGYRRARAAVDAKTEWSDADPIDTHLDS